MGVYCQGMIYRTNIFRFQVKTFHFFKHQASKSILGPPSRFFSCFSWIVIKFLETICGKGPTCVLTLQTEYLEFTKKMKNIWTEVGISLLYIDYHIPTSHDDGGIFGDQDTKGQQKKGKGGVFWSHA